MNKIFTELVFLSPAESSPEGNFYVVFFDQSKRVVFGCVP
jgi:hypothetical protein